MPTAPNAVAGQVPAERGLLALVQRWVRPYPLIADFQGMYVRVGHRVEIERLWRGGQVPVELARHKFSEPNS
jgi:hypothetical protein